MGTRVISAPETRQMLRAPTVPRVSGAPSMAGRASGPSVIRIHNVLQVDKRVLGELISEVMADERAAG